MDGAKYTDVMLDIETLATTPRAHVLSIGAVGFNRRANEVGQGIHLSLAFDQQREIDPNTVVWWMKQSREAQEAAFAGQCPVEQALHTLDQYVRTCAAKCGVWANGPQFDLVILRDLYREWGQKCPWHYRQERDCRTWWADCDDFSPQDPNLVGHNALHDAIRQAKAIQDVYRTRGE